MKKISFLSLIASVLLLTSCDTTREISINENGSGTYSNTMDLSSIIGLAKMSGGEGMDELKDKKMDTTILLASIVDSIPGLSADEKRIAQKGTMHIVMNIDDEKFLTKMDFPFTSVTELGTITKFSGTAMQEALKKQVGDKKGGGASPMGDDDMPTGAIDQYFKYTYSKGLIQRTLIAEKYATVGDDKGMQSMKEMATQGLPMSNKTIIKLPKAAKKAEGKGVKLSDDKKTVTIEDSIEDFFDDGKALEYTIEY